MTAPAAGLRERLLAEAVFCERGNAETAAALLREAASAIDKMQQLCACAYQMAGCHDAPVEWLDALGDAANGEPVEHWRVQGNLIEKLLPYTPAAALPDGWVLVPRNPTEAMIDACRDAPDTWVEAYAAMLAAAPALAQQPAAFNTAAAPVHTQGSVEQQPAAIGEEIMVNAAHDVYTLPLQPSGLLSGPRFVVHVPAPEQQPAAPSAPGCGACADGCKGRGSCRVRDESPPSAPVGVGRKDLISAARSLRKAERAIGRALTATQHQEPTT